MPLASSGDGAGLMTSIPGECLRAHNADLKHSFIKPGVFGLVCSFFSTGRKRLAYRLSQALGFPRAGMQSLGWRKVTDQTICSLVALAAETRPLSGNVYLRPLSLTALSANCLLFAKKSEADLEKQCIFVCSLSSRTDLQRLAFFHCSWPLVLIRLA